MYAAVAGEEGRIKAAAAAADWVDCMRASRRVAILAFGVDKQSAVSTRRRSNSFNAVKVVMLVDNVVIFLVAGIPRFLSQRTYVVN